LVSIKMPSRKCSERKKRSNTQKEGLALLFYL
jgi:hypothetical protein